MEVLAHPSLHVRPERIATIYKQLHRIGALGPDPSHGFLRPAWHPEETEAIEFIVQEGMKLGLTPRFDEIGNVSLETPSGSASYVETGSHLDTVVCGGNYDGAAGVVAGLQAIAMILEADMHLKHGLRLRVWRGEESTTFDQVCKGSRAAFGLLPRATLDSAFRGKTLREAIEEAGYDPGPIEGGRATITRQELDGIVAHLELHIEQANALERQGIDVGVVTSIRGPSRWRIELEGAFYHSGGTPMGVDFRQDANLAFAHIGVELDLHAHQALASGYDLVQTIGVLNTDHSINERDARVYQNAIAKVSGYCYFTLDIRSSKRDFRSTYVQRALNTIHETAARFRVEAKVTRIGESDPLERLDAAVERLLLWSAGRLGLRVCTMASGALHDCLYLGQQHRTDGTPVPIGMVFIPCRGGKSHCPEEYASYEQIAAGASVLAGAMAVLAGERW